MNRSSTTLLLALLSVPALHAQGSEEDSRFKLAQGYEAAGDYKSASRVYKELYDRDPGANAYFEGVRRTYMAMLRFPELLPIVEDRVRKLPRDVELRVLYANLLHRTQKREEGIAQWKMATEIRPDDAQSYDLVAQSQIEVRLFHQAIETYLQGRTITRDPIAFADQLAQLYGVTGQHENATIEYLTLLDQGDFNSSFVMAGLGLFTTNPDGADAAIKVVKRRVESRPDHLPYLELLSWLYIERKDYEGAFEVAKGLDKLRGGRGSDIYAYADRALRERRYTDAVKALEYFQANFPKSNPIYGNVLLNYTRALEGEYREGTPSKEKAEALIEQYRMVVKENAGTVPAAEALLQIARLQAEDLDRPNDAIATLDDIREEYPKFPSLPEALLLQGDLHLRMGDLAKAGALYEAGAGGDFPNSMDAERYRDESALRKAQVLFHTGKFAEAKDAFALLSDNITSPVANDALGYLFLLQENMGKNDSALAHYARGSFLLLQHKWKEAIAAMDRAVSLGGESTLIDEALYSKARGEQGEGNDAGAVATLLGLVEKYPDGTMADRALFRAAELTEQKLGDRAKAIELYTRLLTDYPTSTQAAQARSRVRELRGSS